MKRLRKKILDALKKVGGSSRSRERMNVHKWNTPLSSHDDAPMGTHEQEVESQVLEWQSPQASQGGAPDDSHLVIQGNRENQAYNLLKNRVFNHTRGFDDELLKKTGMDVDFS